MKTNTKAHTFHIPVMGTSYTIDTPIKVAQYGISSVISLVDDILIEKMREFYCEKFNLPFEAISTKIDDFRAKRVTAYLNTVNEIVGEKVDNLIGAFSEKGEELEKYLNILPSVSEIKQKFNQLKETSLDDAIAWLQKNIAVGEIDVNIMTKLDKENYAKGEKLDGIYNDAHASLRGFSNSNLNSSVVLSAGMNPRLYAYFEAFEDFYPNENNQLNKKIVLKVSDYRSAIIQGKFFAKKGLWVSEYRIESGLNCGGHAFATDGLLMGPILAEFKSHRQELIDTTFAIYTEALKTKNRYVPTEPLAIKLSAQGGVGNSEEHEFLLNEYDVDSVGWATPFLLVPEVTTVDKETFSILSKAKEEDLYLSDVSPFGIPFNTVRGSTKDVAKLAKIAEGKPGSPCPKKYLVSTTEYTDKAICRASIKYQGIKIKELEEQNLDAAAYQKEYDAITEKQCLCLGLGMAANLVNGLPTKGEGIGVSVCPGPNLAYFTGEFSLKDMVDHIYGRINVLNDIPRPHMFIKELKMYIDYLQKDIEKAGGEFTGRQLKKLAAFENNINDGITYYKGLFNNLVNKMEDVAKVALYDLEILQNDLKLVTRPLTVSTESNLLHRN